MFYLYYYVVLPSVFKDLLESTTELCLQILRNYSSHENSPVRIVVTCFLSISIISSNIFFQWHFPNFLAEACPWIFFGDV